MGLKNRKKNRGASAEHTVGSTPAETVEENVESSTEETESTPDTSETVNESVDDRVKHIKEKLDKGSADRKDRVKKLEIEQKRLAKVEKDRLEDDEMVEFESNGTSKFMNKAGKIHHITRQTARILTEKGNGKIVK